MILKQPRLCHIVDGFKTYLAEPGEGVTAYRNRVRAAYGNLRGVQFRKLEQGTKLEAAGLRGDYWRICQPIRKRS